VSIYLSKSCNLIFLNKYLLFMKSLTSTFRGRDNMTKISMLVKTNLISNNFLTIQFSQTEINL